MMLTRNLAEEYAQQFSLPEQGRNEANWAFRVRIAYTLSAMNRPVLAHEVLYNQRESRNPFASNQLADGYSLEDVIGIAQRVEATFQSLAEQHMRRLRRKMWVNKFCFWRKEVW